MEKPDANGFVQINWPSKNIPHGGVFHTRVVEPSEATRQFLKVLLEESRLSIEQRSKSKWESNLRREEEERRRPQARGPVNWVRPKTSKRRSLSTIRESGVYEDDGYRPLKRGEDRERLKERLQRSMQYGDADQPQTPKPLKVAQKKVPELPTAKQMRNELLTQIRERAEWLAEMEVLGEAAKHRDIVKDQIAERLRALDALGIDSPCSSARSTASGFSTLGNIEDTQMNFKGDITVRSIGSQKSVHSNKSQEKKKPSSRTSSSRGKKDKEENVSVYENLPPLKRSPRRRC